MIREVTFVAYYTQGEYRSTNWDATYRRWLERTFKPENGRDPTTSLHPENLPVNGRLPKSVLNDMHNGTTGAGRLDEAQLQEEFDEL